MNKTQEKAAEFPFPGVATFSCLPVLHQLGPWGCFQVRRVWNLLFSQRDFQGGHLRVEGLPCLPCC